jgi:hypothetical protein
MGVCIFCQGSEDVYVADDKNGPTRLERCAWCRPNGDTKKTTDREREALLEKAIEAFYEGKLR